MIGWCDVVGPLDVSPAPHGADHYVVESCAVCIPPTPSIQRMRAALADMVSPPANVTASPLIRGDGPEQGQLPDQTQVLQRRVLDHPPTDHAAGYRPDTPHLLWSCGYSRWTPACTRNTPSSRAGLGRRTIPSQSPQVSPPLPALPVPFATESGAVRHLCEDLGSRSAHTARLGRPARQPPEYSHRQSPRLSICPAPAVCCDGRTRPPETYGSSQTSSFRRMFKKMSPQQCSDTARRCQSH